MPKLTEFEGMMLRKLLAPVKGKELFCDPAFPATDASLSQLDRNPHANWKRPHELVAEPQMFVDGVNRSDVNQGELGDCWFLAACASVATRPDLFNKVIPEGQVLYGTGYKGIVSFRFWRMGEWVTVHIDDRLPVLGGNILKYASCKDRNEFWMPLLEKAFAKFHGDYNHIRDGQLVESYTSLTGFITEGVKLGSNDHNELFQLLNKEFKNGSLVACSRGNDNTEGLPWHHTYTLTGAKRIETPTEGLVSLVRIRNPHGIWGEEWTGEWADNDPRWGNLDETTKKELDYKVEKDGEFWMKIAHFISRFNAITIASKIPDISKDVYSKKVIVPNCLFVKHSSWKKGINAGGGPNDMWRFATNPQYLLTVIEPDEGEVCEIGKASDDEMQCKNISTCSVIIELVQEHNRKKYPNLSYIAMAVFKTTKGHNRLTAIDLMLTKQLGGTLAYSAISSAVRRMSLEPGCYLLIPTTYEPEQSREFLLRVYCRSPIKLEELCEV